MAKSSSANAELLPLGCHPGDLSLFSSPNRVDTCDLNTPCETNLSNEKIETIYKVERKNKS